MSFRNREFTLGELIALSILYTVAAFMFTILASSTLPVELDFWRLRWLGAIVWWIATLIGWIRVWIQVRKLQK